MTTFTTVEGDVSSFPERVAHDLAARHTSWGVLGSVVGRLTTGQEEGLGGLLVTLPRALGAHGDPEAGV